ncbi:hypothetical protein IFR04_013097 [Cadophora malorum]|uniref:Uncharacterized protein n=1 Tax=Cadophora malorum TaxID=108018 RepID=A0A8H7T789_9HELO|nr:hypothetical protein IFR04_013097 [Cadophora malorum]
MGASLCFLFKAPQARRNVESIKKSVEQIVEVRIRVKGSTETIKTGGFGTVVKDPGWPEAECRPKSPTAASGTPKPRFEAASNNSQGHSILHRWRRRHFNHFQLHRAGQVSPSTRPLPRHQTSPEYTTFPTSSASFNAVHGNLRIASSSKMADTSLKMSTTQSFSTKTPSCKNISSEQNVNVTNLNREISICTNKPITITLFALAKHEQ